MNKKKEMIIGIVGFFICLFILIKSFMFLGDVVVPEVIDSDMADNLKMKLAYIESYIKDFESVNITFPDNENIVIDEQGYIRNSNFKQPNSGYIIKNKNGQIEYKLYDNGYCLSKLIHEQKGKIKKGKCDE